MEVFDGWIADYEFVPQFSKKFIEPKTNTWTLYGMTSCKFALVAIQAIQINEQDVVCVEVSKKQTRGDIIKQLKERGFKIPKFTTTPIIYNGLKLIGGSKDILKYFKVGI